MSLISMEISLRPRRLRPGGDGSGDLARTQEDVTEMLA